tara:strand:+ start:158 stop:268 length:111 start_codon:yes stop_codon:yes gene_type:complete
MLPYGSKTFVSLPYIRAITPIVVSGVSEDTNEKVIL